MGAFKGASLFFDKPLVEIAESHGYDKDNIYILEDNIEKLKAEFPETYRNLQSCKHHADNRLSIEYAQDIIASWLIEDSFLKMFEEGGLKIELDGADRNRKLLSSAKTSSGSDFVIVHNDSRYKIELMNDYAGYWKKYNKLHLRDNKYNKLKEENALLLAVSIETKEFALYDFREDIKSKFIPSHWPYGGKAAYEIEIPPQCRKEASKTAIIQAIKSKL